MKIPNLFRKDYIISQGLHHQEWNKIIGKVAIDVAIISELYAPFDGNFTFVKREANNRQSYFSISLVNGYELIVVHAEPIVSGSFRKGQPIARCTWHHYHLALKKPDGQLDNFLAYSDRSIPMYTQASLYGSTNHPDGQWSSYKDLFLGTSPTIINTKPMFKFEYEQYARDQFSRYLSPDQARDMAWILAQVDQPSKQKEVVDHWTGQLGWWQEAKNKASLLEEERNKANEREKLLSQEVNDLKKEIEDLSKIGSEYQSKIKELENEDDIYIEPKKEAKKEAFSFNKFFVGLSKFGITEASIISFGTILLNDYISYLSALPEDQVVVGGVSVGVLTIVLKSLKQILKND